MRNAILIVLVIMFSAKAYGQKQDSTIINLKLASNEMAYVYGVLGKQPAEEVEQLRLKIAGQVKDKIEKEKELLVTLSGLEVQYVLNVVAGYPWKDVYQIMPKLFSAINQKQEQKGEGKQ